MPHSHEWLESTFRNVAYNNLKIKPYIFKIFYTIINKYKNNHFKRNTNKLY